MTFLGWFVTILGLFVSLVAGFLTFVTYISPIWRLKYYIKKPKGWKQVFVGREESYWQYSSHPEFRIEIDDESREWQRKEHWMTMYSDEMKSSCLVKVSANGQPLIVEEFIYLDGSRYFVPLPKRKVIGENEEDNQYWYTLLQLDLARIIGKLYFDKTFEDFMKRHNLQVKGLTEDN